jgi:VIT1/CCC1 family predicted Fe2+/Mn2+ transporter
MIKKISSKKKSYNGAIVLGLNDAIVESSGALVGLTFALVQSNLIATAGLITGIAAALSMAASEYLSAKEEGHENPFKASVYTGFTYLITVLILVIPYFILENTYLAGGIMLSLVILIIAGYTKYDSNLHKEKFSKKFAEMSYISLGIAIVSFLVGLLVRKLII